MLNGNNYTTVSYEIKEDIGYFEIACPPANKMTALFFAEFNKIVRTDIMASDVKGILIRGRGRHYSSGADIDELFNNIAPHVKLDENENVIAYPTWFMENRSTFNFFNRLKIPVLSTVTGICVGAGVELAVCSHIRICGTGSILGLVESTFGILPGACGTLKSIEILGLGKAMEMAFSGETYTAEEAMEFGLIDRVIDKKGVFEYAENLLKHIVYDEGDYSREEIPTYINNFENKYYKNILLP